MRMKELINQFMVVNAGRAGINIKLSKFGVMIIALFMIFIFVIASNIVIREISQRNRAIEKHRVKIDRLKKDIEKRDRELEELKEFKQLMEAVKDLSKRVLNNKEQKELAKSIYFTSLKYKYNWRTIMAVIMTESNFRAKLASRDPSYGLMQIKLRTAREAGKKIGVDINSKYSLYSIDKNVLIGSFYLFEQIIAFKDVKKAIVAYNLGPTKTRRITRKKVDGKIETNYLIKVSRNYNYLKEYYTSKK